MVTKEQVIKGIITYADNEVIPQLPTTGKWGLGSMILMTQDRMSELLNDLSTNSVVNALGVINSDGMIDIEIISNALIQTANRYGKCEFNIPLIGCLSFSARDVEMLKTYIIGGVTNA